MGAEAALARHVAGAGACGTDRGPSGASAPHLAADSPAGVGAGRSADRHRVAASGRARSRQRAGRDGAVSARSDPRARARAHPPPRLPGQPAADARRDSALLPSRPSGGCRTASASSARTAATISRSACAAMRTPTRGRLPTSKSCAAPTPAAPRHCGYRRLAVPRVRRLLGAPSHAAAARLARRSRRAAARRRCLGGIAAGAEGPQSPLPHGSPRSGTALSVSALGRLYPSRRPRAKGPAAPPPADARSSGPPQPSNVAPPAVPPPRDGAGRARRYGQPPSISQSSSDSHGNWSWSDNGDRLEVTYSGTFEFTDDDTDVRQFSAAGG